MLQCRNACSPGMGAQHISSSEFTARSDNQPAGSKETIVTTTLVNAYRGLSTTAPRGTTTNDSGSVLGHLLQRIGSWFGEQRRYRQTMNELSALTDRELDDIGLRRSEIDRVAQRCAHCG